MLSKRELLEKIRLGEDSFLELKEVRFAGNKITLKSLSLIFHHYSEESL